MKHVIFGLTLFLCSFSYAACTGDQVRQVQAVNKDLVEKEQQGKADLGDVIVSKVMLRNALFCANRMQKDLFCEMQKPDLEFLSDRLSLMSSKAVGANLEYDKAKLTQLKLLFEINCQ